MSLFGGGGGGDVSTWRKRKRRQGRLWLIGRQVGTVSGACAVELRDDEELTEDCRVFCGRDVPDPSQRARTNDRKVRKGVLGDLSIISKDTRFYL